MHKHPPPVSGGYGRRLKKKESAKGFTLVELIVVIVILAILAAILIPGLLKWIDQAKDKKYELEAREIALAAEAAMAKVYADGGVEVTQGYWGGLYTSSTKVSQENFMKLEAFKQEIEKLTDAEIKAVYPFGAGFSSEEYSQEVIPWEGDVGGFLIYFVSDGVNIKANYMSGPAKSGFGSTNYHKPTDGWVITKNPSDWDTYAK